MCEMRLCLMWRATTIAIYAINALLSTIYLDKLCGNIACLGSVVIGIKAN